MTRPNRNVLIVSACLAVLIVVFGYEVAVTRPVRQAVNAYAELVSLSNRTDIADDARIAASRPFFTTRYQASHRLRMAAEGGIVGLPRSIHKNFQAWRQGDEVWICPTNRLGPVYRLVQEGGRWRFDGLVGLLRSRNEMVPAREPLE